MPRYFGDAGGVGMSRAYWRTSGGGRARGDIMIPGAREGSCGRRDQIAQPPTSGKDGEATGEVGCDEESVVTRGDWD